MLLDRIWMLVQKGDLEEKMLSKTLYLNIHMSRVVVQSFVSFSSIHLDFTYFIETSFTFLLKLVLKCTGTV